MVRASANEAAELQELVLWREGEGASDILVDEERAAKIREEIGNIAIHPSHEGDAPS